MANLAYILFGEPGVEAMIDIKYAFDMAVLRAANPDAVRAAVVTLLRECNRAGIDPLTCLTRWSK